MRRRLYLFTVEGCSVCKEQLPIVNEFRKAYPDVEVKAYDLTETGWPEMPKTWWQLLMAKASGQPIVVPAFPDVTPAFLCVDEIAPGKWGNPRTIEGKLGSVELIRRLVFGNTDTSDDPGA